VELRAIASFHGGNRLLADMRRDTRAPMSQLHEVLSSLRLVQYRTRWGDPIQTSAVEIGGGPLKLHVFACTDEHGRPFHTILTDGLSDYDNAIGAPRCELVWYVNTLTRELSDWLYFLGTVIRVDRLDPFYRIIPVASPPSNQSLLAPGSQLTSATFINSPLLRDKEAFVVQGKQAYALWLLPVTEAERAWLNTHKGEAFGAELGALLDRHQHPFVLDPMRASYV
jgi:hypothetical protein